MLRPPRLNGAVAWLLIALVLVCTWRWYAVWEPLLFAAAAFGFACLYLADWLTWRFGERLHEIQNARSMSERVKMLEILSGLTSEQLELLNEYAPVMEVIAGNSGPIYQLVVLHDHAIPMTFIEQYLSLGDQVSMYPIRRLRSEQEREWAAWFVEYMTMMGYAQPAAGNRPARWRDYRGAIRALGLQD